MIEIRVKKLVDHAIVPTIQTEFSAGADVHAAFPSADSDFLYPGQAKLVPTGLSVEIPIGYEIQVRPRSGLALKHGITVLNSPGTIDSDYRGELCVLLVNHGEAIFTIKNGDRIAQLVVAVLPVVRFVEAEDLSETKRGEGGFGSTGQ